MGCKPSRLARSRSAASANQTATEASNSTSDLPAPCTQAAESPPVDSSLAGGGSSTRSEAGTSAAPVCPSDTDTSCSGAPAPMEEEAPVTATAPKVSSEHRYNSFERPSRSAMRPSMDGGSRRVSLDKRVGFQVKDQPSSHRPSLAAEDSSNSSVSSYAHADAVSLKKIVDLFYDRVLHHADLSPFFEGIDMAKLKRHQVKFMSLAFGGKELVNEEEPGLDLRKIHHRLIKDKGLTLEHWETFVELFEEVLDEIPAIPSETRTSATASIRATKPFFVPVGQDADAPVSIAGAAVVSPESA